jgi:hypothetical protein
VRPANSTGPSPTTGSPEEAFLIRAATLLLFLSLTAAALAQGRTPELVAAQAGASDCAALAREIGAERVVVGRYVAQGATLVLPREVAFEFSACFRDAAACERFMTEMRFDYEGAERVATCRRGAPAR